jgi:hypothetical protein
MVETCSMYREDKNCVRSFGRKNRREEMTFIKTQDNASLLI